MDWRQVVGAVVLVLLLVGVSTPFWSAVGVARLLRRPVPAWARGPMPDRSTVAVLIAAHDEELVLANTLRSAATQVDPSQVFVASDGSTDGTAAIARRFGANVLELHPNRGKAGALAAAIEHFHLADRFEVVMLLDADTVLAADYLDTGLPMFSEADVVAVAGTAATRRDSRPSGLVGRVLVAYRERVYIVFQYLQKFGQAARGANVVSIVPGFASMYRARILSQIEITAPGLTIEDFNMTFEVHAKRLGRIAFRPGAAVAYTQDPDTLRDYKRQVERWTLGFWQTVRRHRWRPDRFWTALGVYVGELVVGSTAFVLLVPAIAVSSLAELGGRAGFDPGAGEAISAALPVPVLLAGALVPDYALTVVGAVIARRPMLLLIGLLFPLVRLLDAVVCLERMVAAARARSDGVWSSPARRPVLRVLEEEPQPVPARSATR
jgi:cellulose synthase/poly-beta-1,6-N-acetylglucosamine synthase-like glycosyltransferase